MTLPEAKGGQSQLGDTLIVGIDNLEQLSVNQAPVTKLQLTQQLQDYVKTKPQGVIVLNADRAVPYARVLQVLDLLQAVNGSNVALGTTQPVPSKPQVPVPSPNPGKSQPSPAPPLAPGVTPQLSPSPPVQTPPPTGSPGVSVSPPPSSSTAIPTIPTVPSNPGIPTIPSVPVPPTLNPGSTSSPSPTSAP